MPVSAESRVGTELLGYRIESLLGRGGMSAVYRAHDPRLKRDVALKVLAPGLAEDDAFRERFLSESELAAGLEHPNVVPIHDVGEIDGQLFIVMRLVEQGDLKSMLGKEGKLDARRGLALVSQVAAALDAAHERGLVHRDVKPSNVLVDGRGHAYLADFGLSRRLSDQAMGFEAGLSLGTPAYVAPEQIEGKKVDGRADQYSLGCLLYECLCGERPFPRSTEAAVLFAHLEETPPTLPGLEEVFGRALAKDPDARYASCTESVDAAVDALGITVRRRSLWPLAFAAIGFAVVVASAAAFFLTWGGGSASAELDGRLLRINPTSDRVTASTPVGDGAAAVAVGSGRVWVASYRDGTLWQLDPRSGAVTSVPGFGRPHGVTVHGGKAYVAALGPGAFGGNVSQFDAVSGNHTGGNPVFTCSLTSGTYGVWIAGCPDVYELRIDGGNVLKGPMVRIPFRAHLSAANIREGLAAMAMGEGAVWVVGDPNDPTLWRIDPRQHRVVSTIRLGFPPAGVAAGEGAVWVTDQLDDRLVEVNPITNRIVKSIQVGRGAGGVAVGAGSVWVAGAIDHTVTRVDPSAARVVDTLHTAASPQAVAVGDGAVWVVGDAR
jgi:DNA-binding beta-propeller fold protein YncE